MTNPISVQGQNPSIDGDSSFYPPDADALSTQCYACGICTSSCPISLVPEGLDPRRIVRLANLGGLCLDRVGSSIWHCLDCRRCGNLCPNSVKPWLLIANLQRRAVAEHRVSMQTVTRIHQLKQELVTVLSNALSMADPPLFDALFQQWDQWACPPEVSPKTREAVGIKPLKRSLSHTMNHSLCMTCRECSSACPLTVSTADFDPLYFIRCYVLGVSPERASLWSCLGCESCSQACSQSVQGHLVIKALQMEQEGFFSVPFQIRINTTREQVFRAYVSRVDALVAGDI
ncbi:two domain fusion protein (N:Fe-S oxidoreductase-C:4Fe-4S ferredoxin) [Desulforapulum autotrophicum HRM2]|uniref:Two domain fusion protein (N:Fe-S oxidoreductase-C:4Fe-4S ferredoxin) n=1 Tax=Desulforapulum autotrophicum (strain ATCC 43914 / DSM 3382 / VKM B-1955 / HRM2) TaxID=177437 RepID=C0QD03_DESAH|nr:4Fe-4S dicluster domain-containing protein [Desulforapulum autotrophicum]ACN17235.1 two domain fusion protein (N:Fe-S oxidoreductase-C:4Fe-4S ferredoxin) [Desulforapulum autotrophicum HRM2]